MLVTHDCVYGDLAGAASTQARGGGRGQGKKNGNGNGPVEAHDVSVSEVAAKLEQVELAPAAEAR